ncbi:hypothetical protein GJ496_009183 [Pomphorhynchus laevis]|nr:hypothetical protein GJ496_009183 [Pomphorhynchus laevis]
MADAGTGDMQILNDSDKKIKTARQIDKELKKKAKLERFHAKSQNKNNSIGVKKDTTKDRLKVITYTGSTDPGMKKDLTEFPDSYSPKFVEACWYAWWQKQGYFRPEYCPEFNIKPAYVIILPPPNVTGTLHLGHALTCTLQDSLARFHRMKGQPVLWLPGCDHAGIATQVVVEKRLWRDHQKTRFDFGRQDFIEKVWEWKRLNGDRIYEQIKLMGSSCDWNRSVFTMDELHSKAVEEVFIRLFESKQIYRSSRIVNWSVSLQSVISDIEVEKTPITGKTWINVPGYDKRVLFGCLTSFIYKLIDVDGEIAVATTRLETMLGDVAISVHPNDDRYKKYHGMHAQHPFFPERKILIVTDEDVDMQYGTGAVKISPGHDFHDFEVAERYNLPIISCIDGDGCISSGFGEFTGMKRLDARGYIANKLKSMDMLRETTDVNMVLPICSRSRDVIEPLIKPQWFLRMKDDALRAWECIKNSKIKVIPERYVNDCQRWLINCRDWCISRQLWWGHQLPVYKIMDGQFSDWVAAYSEDEARLKAKRQWPNLSADFSITRDLDVLDTWFSSSLFPFSVFGWPNETDDLKRFYPGTLLETGHDILFYWVIRMIIMSLKINDEIPFRQVYLHGLIRDSHGRKMSKSLGNIIDPMNVVNGVTLEDLHSGLLKYNLSAKEIELARQGQKSDFPNGIPECGTDAMRFAFLAYSSQSSDINLDILRIQGYRHFCNKIWQAFRFALFFAFPVNKIIPLTCVDWINCIPARWILSRLAYACDECSKGFEQYDFARSTTAIYNFWLYELCDVYIELVKPHLKQSDSTTLTMIAALYFCLDNGLRILHPAMPFITEELYNRLPIVEHSMLFESVSIAPFPDPDELFVFRCSNTEELMQLAQSCVSRIRRICKDSEYKSKVSVIIECLSDSVSERLTKINDVIMNLSNCERISFGPIVCNDSRVETITNEFKLLVTPINDLDVDFSKSVSLSEK